MPTHPPTRYAGLHIAAWWARAGLKSNRHRFTLPLFRHGRPFPMARPVPPDLKLGSHLLRFPIVGRLRKSALPTSLDRGLTKQAKQTRPCATPPQPAERNFPHSVVLCLHSQDPLCRVTYSSMVCPASGILSQGFRVWNGLEFRVRVRRFRRCLPNLHGLGCPAAPASWMRFS